MEHSRRTFIRQVTATGIGIAAINVTAQTAAAINGAMEHETVKKPLKKSLKKPLKKVFPVRKQAIFLPAGSDNNKTFALAAGRLIEYGGEFDLLCGSPDDYDLNQWEIVVLLGEKTDPRIKSKLSVMPASRHSALDAESPTPNNPDSFLIAIAEETPLTLIVAGETARATLYAAYCLADVLKSGDDLRQLKIERSPLIENRFVFVTSTLVGGLYFAPGMFNKTLHELPRYGYNGLVVSAGGQGACLVSDHDFPIMGDGNGGISVNKYILPEWEDMLARVKEYGLEVILTLPPVTPDFFDSEMADAFYLGGAEPEGYTTALSIYFEKYLNAIYTALPGLNGFIIGSTEGIEFGKHRRYYLVPEPIGKNPETLAALHKNNEKIARAYFGVFERFCRARGLKAIFISHIAGTPNVTLLEIRRVVYDYPDIICLEDDYWNNNLWIFDLPAMNYLPESAREEAAKHNFGMIQWCTDAEYYGGASLPNAYPDTMVATAREAVRLKAKLFAQRLNLHDRTPYGTLFSTAEIIPFASSRQVWSGDNNTGLDALWREWTVRRFGNTAAEHVIPALKNSKDILLNGLQMNGSYLIMHSAIHIYEWGIGGNCFKLFGKPGVRLVEKKAGEIIFGWEQYLLQMKTASFTISEFRQKNAYALTKTNESISLLESAKNNLAEKDYQILTEPFYDAIIILGMLGKLGEAAYSTNLVLANFDHVADPAGLLRTTIANLRAYNENVIKPRGSNLMHPPLYDAINELSALYEAQIPPSLHSALDTESTDELNNKI